jgi:hypothetical protein
VDEEIPLPCTFSTWNVVKVMSYGEGEEENVVAHEKI